MPKCISKGKKCKFLSFNRKGNFTYHCGYHRDYLVQLCVEDLEKSYPCPLDMFEPQKKRKTEDDEGY